MMKEKMEKKLQFIREKVGSENKNKVFTEEEKANYLNNLRNKYKNQKSIEQQFVKAKLVNEKDKEHILDVVFDFFTSSELAGEDYTRLEDKEQLKKFSLSFSGTSLASANCCSILF